MCAMEFLERNFSGVSGKDAVHSKAVCTQELTKVFGRREVISKCSMTVEQGTIYGFLGKNGAGKTTMFKLLLGLLKPTAGTAKVLGNDSIRDNQKILGLTGSMIETPVFYEHLPARENLRIHLAYMNLGRGHDICENAVDHVLDLTGLGDVGNDPVQAFSMGMRQRLALARALIHRPRLLILDEPTNGLDPAGIREMRSLFHQLAHQEKITILLSSHLLSEVVQVTERIGVIAGGRIVLEMDTADLLREHSRDFEDFLIEAMKGRGERHV